MVEYWGSKDTKPESYNTEQRADDKGRGSIIITNDNRHIYPQDSKHESEKPNWVEKGTLFALILTFVAACFAGYEAFRLANWTQIAVSDSETSGEQQMTAAKDALVAANRAWVGPAHAIISGPVKDQPLPITKDQPLMITFQYVNTGREPALNVLVSHADKAYSIQQWNDGTAAKEIESNAEGCMKIEPTSDVQIAYPTSFGSFYSLIFQTDQSRVRYVATDDLIAAKEIYVAQGCFAYLSIKKARHSAFCYYYQAGLGPPGAMSICNTGNKAD